MLDKLSWRIKIGLIIVFVLVLVKFILVPLSGWQDLTRQRIKILQRSIAQKKSLIGNEARINELLKKAEFSYKETIKFYFTNFSDTQSLQLILQKEMERLSVSSGVKIKNTDWPYPLKNEIVKAPIRIKCEAAPDQMIRFVRAIEQAPHFFSIDQLKMISKQKSSTITAEFDISAYGTPGINNGG